MQIRNRLNHYCKRWLCKMPVLLVVLLGLARTAYAGGDKPKEGGRTTATHGKTKVALRRKAPVVTGYADLSFEQLHAEFMPDDKVQTLRDSARTVLDAVAKSSAWIDAIGANATVQAPFGIKTQNGGTEYQVGFSNISFGVNGGTARVFARLIIPQQDENGDKKQLFFCGNVALSRVGGVISGGKLALIGDEPVRPTDKWSMVLHGSDLTSSHDADELTYFAFDCNGFTELGLNGEVVLSRDFYQPLPGSSDPSGRISAEVDTTVTAWDNMMLTGLKFENAFTVKGIKHYRFEIGEATLDFSDEENPDGGDDFQDYLDKVQPDEQDTWRGLYINDITVGLPPEFSPRGMSEGIELSCEYAVLDGAGLSTMIDKEDVIALGDADSGSWAMSIDKLSLEVARNAIGGGSLEGKLILPIQDKEEVLEKEKENKEKEEKEKKENSADTKEGTTKKDGTTKSTTTDSKSATGTSSKPASGTTAAGAPPAPGVPPAASAPAAAGAQTPAAASSTAKTTTTKDSTTHIAKDTTAAKDPEGEEEEEEANAISFSGKITADGDYEITAGFEGKIKAPFLKAELELDESSVLTLAVIDGKFRPKVVLSGELTFGTDGEKEDSTAKVKTDSTRKKIFSCEGIRFEEMTLQLEKPYFSIKTGGVSGSLNIASFEAAYSVDFTTEKPEEMSNVKEDMVTLNLAADIKLMDGKIGGKTDLALYAIYDEKEGQWKYYDYTLGSIGINADFGKAAFEGSLTLLRNDPVYGNGFAGSLSLRVNEFKVAAQGIFGTKNNAANLPFRYWSVDAMVNGLRIPAGAAIVFTGFSGGVSYKMNLSDQENPRMPSGVAYVPDDSAFLRVRAGVLFDVPTNKVMTATAGLEIVFNKNWGVNTAIITGTAKVMPGVLKTDSKLALMQGLKSNTATDAASKAAAAKKGDKDADAAIWGDLTINLDFINNVYQGNMNVYVNFEDMVTGGYAGYKAGVATFYVTSNKWYIHVGTNTEPITLQINQTPINAAATGYFMMGNDVQAGGSTGFGVRQGLAFDMSVDYESGWLYANVSGGIKYDMILFKNDNFYCNGKLAGLNGWYGSANLSAWLKAKVGVRFWDIDFNVLNASLYAAMQVRGPKPLYFYGTVNGHYDVGWGWFSKEGNFTVEVTKGTYCPF